MKELTSSDFRARYHLPFVGRQKELDTLLELWNGIGESNEMQAALVVGEAGMGKSRLIEELIPGIDAAGGVVLHVKLVPESTSSIVSLLIQAFTNAPTVNQLILPRPEQDLISVAAALRRLSRLRLMMLVVEDAHLLGGEGLREFAALLRMVATETFLLVCFARPVELPVRGALQQHLVREIDLNPLTEDELDTLWRGIFAVSLPHDYRSLLAKTTRGLPLALRSVLRNAVISGVVEQEQGTKKWVVRPDLRQFEEFLHSAVRSVSEGYIIHLLKDELEGAIKLSMLGELFSREASRIVLGDADTILEQLVKKGILVEVSSFIKSFPGASSKFPLLSFTHTLVHEYLAEKAKVEDGGILSVVANGAPIYSVKPFFQLEHYERVVEESFENVQKAIDRMMDVAKNDLDRSTDWKMSIPLWNVAARLAERHSVKLIPEQYVELQAKLYYYKINLLRRAQDRDACYTAAQKLLELTSTIRSEKMALYRLEALSARNVLGLFRKDTKAHLLLDEIEKLVLDYPELRYNERYINHLGNTSRAYSEWNANLSEIKKIEQRFEEIAHSERWTNELDTYADSHVRPTFLKIVETREQLQRRLELIERLDSNPAMASHLLYQRDKITFAMQIGQGQQAARMNAELIPQAKKTGLSMLYKNALLSKISLDGAMGVGLAEIAMQLQEVVSIIDSDPSPKSKSFRNTIMQISIIRGDVKWGINTIRGLHLSDDNRIDYDDWISSVIFSFLTDQSNAILDKLDISLVAVHSQILALLIQVYRGESEIEDSTVKQLLREWSTKEIVTMGQCFLFYGIVLTLNATSKKYPLRNFTKDLKTEIHDALVRMLEWLRSTSYPIWIGYTTEVFGKYLTSAEKKEWKEFLADILKKKVQQKKEQQSAKILRASMLGEMLVHGAAEPVPLRGGRNRTLFGLMVADQILERPLTFEEFYPIAIGDEKNPGKARRSLNVAVFRLREVLGAAAISTEGDTPKLNPEYIEVDLINAHKALSRAEDAIRTSAFNRATPALMEVLDIINGEVPFPGLYDTFFEAARDDFEYRLRTAIITVARWSLSEHDTGSAEHILKRGYDMLPGDDELADLLQDALETMGKHAERERVRMRRKISAGN